ncbi:hypothetical protein U1Q18_044556 [Sarracenia purpurea var. burkii]
MRHHLVLLSLPRRREIWLRVEANKEDSSGLVNPIRFPDLGGEEYVEESLVVPPLVVPASDGSVGHKGSFVEDDVPVSEDKYGSSVAEKVPVAPISGGESNEIYDIEFNSEIGRVIGYSVMFDEEAHRVSSQFFQFCKLEKTSFVNGDFVSDESVFLFRMEISSMAISVNFDYRC